MMKSFFKMRMLDKDYRHTYARGLVEQNLAHQIRKLRADVFGTQKNMEENTGRKQSVISRLESAGYGKLTLSTLFDLARDFDVFVQIRFVSMRDFLCQNSDLSWEALAAKPFAESDLEDTVSVLAETVKVTSPFNYGNHAHPLGTMPNQPAKVIPLSLPTMEAPKEVYRDHVRIPA